MDLLTIGHLGGADHFVLVLEEKGEVAVRRTRDRMRVYGPARPSSVVLPCSGMVVAGARGPDDCPIESQSRVLQHVPSVPQQRRRLAHLGVGEERVPPDRIRRNGSGLGWVISQQVGVQGHGSVGLVP